MRKYFQLIVLTFLFFPSVVCLAQQPPISKTTTTSAQKNTTPVTIPNGRIAVINTAMFLEGIEEYKRQIGKLEQEFQARTKELQSLKEKLDALEQEVSSGGQNLKPEVLKQKSEQYDSLKKEFQRKGEDYQTDINKRKEVVLGPLNEKVYKFLQDYSNSHGIVIVFDLAQNGQTGIILTADQNSNITDDFIKEYNKVNPVASLTTDKAK